MSDEGVEKPTPDSLSTVGLVRVLEQLDYVVETIVTENLSAVDRNYLQQHLLRMARLLND